MIHVDGNLNVAGCVCTSDCEMPCWQRVGMEAEYGVPQGWCCCAHRKIEKPAVDVSMHVTAFHEALWELMDAGLRAEGIQQIVDAAVEVYIDEIEPADRPEA